MASVDILIIGAGHNGLVAATYLAKAGKSVVVLERRDVAGGQRSWDLATRARVASPPAAPPTPAFVGRAPPYQGPALPWVARDPTWRLIDFENRYVCQDGTIRHVSWVATPLADEQLMYCIGRDITARKRSEASEFPARRFPGRRSRQWER